MGRGRWVERYGMTRERLRSHLWRKQSWVCNICSKEIPADKVHGHTVDIDHKRPLSHNGPDVVSNLALTHKRCNSLKGDQCEGCEFCDGSTEEEREA